MPRKKEPIEPASTRKMYKRVLVANRGLIAANCVRAIKELGATAIAVYEDGDRDSAGVRNADEAYLLTQNDPSVRPYLDMDQLIELARKHKVDAIHPGYGFLAQSGEFATRLHKAGIAFIAPASEDSSDLTNKAETLSIADKLSFDTLPRSPVIKNADTIKGEAQKIGYPLVIKPVHGYGGIGIRVVNEASELEKAYEQSVSIAQNFLLSSTDVYLEGYLPECTHIEFPILRDGKGHTVVLPELECTLQRRHQKLMVETPAPFLSQSMRQRLESEVKVLADRIGILGLASVEFLVRKRKVYFIEINGFVQPSHTATSVLTGVDMLKRQISILAGNELRLQQSQVSRLGHVIGAYIAAEDPENDFTPSPGHIDRLYLPFGEGVFVQTSVFAGATVSPFYDPAIAKVFARGTTREETTIKTQIALQEFFIEGVKNNIPLLRSVICSEDFKSGTITTDYLEDRKRREELLAGLSTPTEAEIAALVSALALQKDSNSQHILERARQNQDASVWSAASRWMKRRKH